MALLSAWAPQSWGRSSGNGSDEGRITECTAKWGTLMLSFPAYLHRWPSTLVMASMAGLSGTIFALVILIRTAARFVLLLYLQTRKNEEDDAWLIAPLSLARSVKFGMKIFKTLPLAGSSSPSPIWLSPGLRGR